MSVRNYAILYGGVRKVTGGATVGGGDQLLTTEQHALDGTEHTEATGTTRLLATEDHSGLLRPLSGSHDDRLRGDGTWDASGDEFLTAAGGEGHTPETITAGATETLDLSSANLFDLTLTTNLTLTFSNPSTLGVVGIWTLVIRSDGVSSVTWPASVVWRDTDGTQTATAPDFATVAGAIDTVILTTLDGGATYGASLENGSNGGGASALDDLTDVTLTAPAEDDTLRYVGGVWINDNRRWEPVTTNPGTGPELVWDGDEIVMNWATY